jgi:prepilin-type N-terminal cleavage/methylation domain-containing protein
MKSNDRGFTMIEVLIALVIAASAMILVSAACRDGLNRSMRANRASEIDMICERKINEILTGLETATQGSVAGSERLSWKLECEAIEVKDLEQVERISVSIHDNGVELQRIATLRWIQK